MVTLELILTFLSGGAIVAIIGLVGDRLKFKWQRKATKEDRAEEKHDAIKDIYKHMECFEGMSTAKDDEFDTILKELLAIQKAQCEALKFLLLDRILFYGKYYSDKGEITFDERKRLRDMHNVYHQPPLNGNGDADLVMRSIDDLPLAK